MGKETRGPGDTGTRGSEGCQVWKMCPTRMSAAHRDAPPDESSRHSRGWPHLLSPLSPCLRVPGLHVPRISVPLPRSAQFAGDFAFEFVEFAHFGFFGGENVGLDHAVDLIITDEVFAGGG